MDALGFRLSAGCIRVQPGKPERVLTSLRDLLAVPGGASSTFLKQTEALRDFNALIRGFRNYFALPDEPEIDRQMRDLDTGVEELAGDEHQAGAFVKLIMGTGEYQPFRMRW